MSLIGRHQRRGCSDVAKLPSWPTHLGCFLSLGVIHHGNAPVLGRSERDLMAGAAGERAKALWGCSTGVAAFWRSCKFCWGPVAGLDAGRFFVDWPLMQRQFFPPEAFTMMAGLRNFL